MTQTPFLDGPTDGYVFIITYGRSGSTLLQNVLNAIPGYCIRGENNNALFHMARAWDAVAHCEAIQGEKGPTGRSHPWFGAELLDADVLGRGLAETFVRDVLQPEPGARVSGFKEIRFHLTGAHVDSYLDFILRFFPKARFVFNTRSHDGVAKSGWWASMDPAAVKYELDMAERRFDLMRARLGDRAIALHYDDYSGQPQALKPLFDFLGEPFDADQIAEVMGQRLTHTGTRATLKA